MLGYTPWLRAYCVPVYFQCDAEEVISDAIHASVLLAKRRVSVTHAVTGKVKYVMI